MSKFNFLSSFVQIRNEESAKVSSVLNNKITKGPLQSIVDFKIG